MLQQMIMLFPAHHLFWGIKLHHVRLLGDDIKLGNKHTLGYLLRVL